LKLVLILNKPQGKGIFLSELLPIWSKISDSITREHYIEKLAAFLQVKDDFVREELDKYQKTTAVVSYKQVLTQTTPQAAPPAKLISYDRREMLEQYLIALLLHQPIDSSFIPNFPETLFTQEELKQVYVLLVLFWIRSLLNQSNLKLLLLLILCLKSL